MRHPARAGTQEEADRPPAEPVGRGGGVLAPEALHRELAGFRAFGRPTAIGSFAVPGAGEVPVYTNEFWTSRQRQAHSLHEISYRACFKPQLPAFFIERLTNPGDVVYDPFMGRGTTPLEAALHGRIPWGCDINPVSAALVTPRIRPPEREEVEVRIASLPLTSAGPVRDDLLAFFHPDVLEAITALRSLFASPDLPPVDAWLRMVATNRLTGHSPGFFSVYTLPPNQAVSVQSQLRINRRRNQQPPPRDVRAILARKSRSLLADLTAAERATLARVANRAKFLTASCDTTPELPGSSVDLIVTSPPFLNEVNYRTDNWLRCWFHGLDSASIPIWQVAGLRDWQTRMTLVFSELRRVLRPGGWIAFEVGEIRKGTMPLESAAAAAGVEAGLIPELLMIQSQTFTKTSNCWGVSNGSAGTNTNRIVLFRKAGGP